MGHVRTASVGDAEAIAAIYAPYVRDTVISFEEIPPSAADMAARIASTLERLPYLVFDQGGGPIGYAYASAHAERAAYRWSVNVTAYVAPQAHRRGVGRALYAELLGLLERQGFHAAFAGITLPNDNSIGLHEAMGFVHLGTYREVGFKHGAWRDVGYWRRSLIDGPPTGEPAPFPSLRDRQ
ncbi:MAG TPA: arsinothricin resistance N-acetyltransferase ArsN1 family B [Caulobacteraceae bacterium]|nr:arsinothricin resistance N-acetyltransferase ArsN1 family B [Caulobacteraceae bacterium]